MNPARLEGQKTGAFEVCDDLGRAPDILAIPVGNAGNISAYWQGFREYEAAGIVAATPAMWGFQAAGAAPLVLGRPVEHPETIATAIRIGEPASWTKAVAARDESGGRSPRSRRGDPRCVSRSGADRGGVLRAVLGGVDGGVAAAARAGELGSDAVVVAVLTGSGLKDLTAAERIVSEAIDARRRSAASRSRSAGEPSAPFGWLSPVPSPRTVATREGHSALQRDDTLTC